MKTILTNCTIIDCTGKPPVKDMTIVVEGEKIVALNQGKHQQADVKLGVTDGHGAMIRTGDAESMRDCFMSLLPQDCE